MAPKLRITTAICTWNRSKLLRATLLGLRQLTIPAAIDWEVLIVDNNCTDDTDEVIGQFTDTLPIRLLHEKRQGLSNARNCAVAAARGDYILWTDDDAIVEPNWLVAYVNAVRSWPNAALFGGPIKLKLEGNPPPWFAEMLCDETFACVYAHRDPSKIPLKLNSADWRSIPYGPNLCIRMREQQNLRYKPNLGRCKNQQIRGEETELVTAILNSGAEGWWVPDAIVYHVISQNLQTQSHLRSYFIGLGRGFVRNDPKSKFGSFLRAVRLLSPAIQEELRFQTGRLRKPPKIWLEDLRTASIRWGTVYERLRSCF